MRSGGVAQNGRALEADSFAEQQSSSFDGEGPVPHRIAQDAARILQPPSVGRIMK